MSINGDLIDLATLCERGRAEIIYKEVRYERGRYDMTVECTVVLEVARRLNTESSRFMMRLLQAHEDGEIRVDQILTHYDGRDGLQCEIRFFTDQQTYEWINVDEMVRRRGRDRLGRRRVEDTIMQREVLGQPVPSPQLSQEGQRTFERLRQEYFRISPRSPGSRQIPDSRTSPHTLERPHDHHVQELEAMRMVMPDTASGSALQDAAQIAGISGHSADQVIIDDPLVTAIADERMDPGTIRLSVDYGGPSITAVNIVSAEYGSTLTVPKCKIGNPDTHTWVDVPAEGPTARRCSICKRVTGTFWSPDDYKRFIEWLVTNTKILVLLWARNLDATEFRFSLLETDSNRKTTEESTTDDDAVIRFGLLDLK